MREDIRDKFLEWHFSLPLLGQLTIPRCYFTEPVDQIELHMFGDSSRDVFCAFGFLRARLSSSHKTQISFIFGKAYVAPMKVLSIPKLELQAALLTTRLKDGIMTFLSVSINHDYMWADSTTVLQCLNSTEKLPGLHRTNDWPFIPDERMINKIRLRVLLVMLITAWRHYLSSSQMSHPSNIPITGSIGKGSVLLRDIKA